MHIYLFCFSECVPICTF